MLLQANYVYVCSADSWATNHQSNGEKLANEWDFQGPLVKQSQYLSVRYKAVLFQKTLTFGKEIFFEHSGVLGGEKKQNIKSSLNSNNCLKNILISSFPGIYLKKKKDKRLKTAILKSGWDGDEELYS